MKYSIPQAIPEKNAFIREMLTAVFPENTNGTAHSYYNLCDDIKKLYGMNSDEDFVRPNDNLYRLMYELHMYNNGASLTQSKVLEEYQKFIEKQTARFSDTNNGVLGGWLSDNSGRITVYYPTAVFFTLLLMSRPECEATREDFLRKCLTYIGVEEIDDIVWRRMTCFDWKETDDELTQVFTLDKDAKGTFFYRLTNSGIIITGLTIMTILRLIGIDMENDQQRIEEILSGWKSSFEKLFSEEIAAADAMKQAEEKLWKDMRYFEPRSINTARNKLNPQDFFVIPTFKDANGHEVNPAELISKAARSKRCMIVGNTGRGKSMYLQLFVFCMLYNKYSSEQNAKVQNIQRTMNVPDDMYVISVPARMFSACYLETRYKGWTEDFITLYFNCMWKLTGSNFFSVNIHETQNDAGRQYQVTDTLKDYLKHLARQGKLLLVLDSYDEIVSGDMRQAYNKAVCHFYDNYCNLTNIDEVGAHVILSTRKMSPQTMQKLCASLVTMPDSDLFEVQKLNSQQRRQLIENWNYIFNQKSRTDTEALLEAIDTNHFCLECAVNPYMLSVICVRFEMGMEEITQLYMHTLSELMLSKTRRESLEVQGVIGYMDKILEDIAGETVLNNQPHFSRQKLNSYLKNRLTSEGLTDQEIDSSIERLHEIFATVIGMIVPADGSDSDYQFINEQIRYDLAARAFQRNIEKQDRSMAYHDVIFPEIKSIKEYVGFIVPLICNFKDDDYPLAESLVYDLAMHEYDTAEEEELLLTAMLDLLLNRYSPNIATYSSPGVNVQGYVRRAQRILLMRILTAARLTMTSKESKKFKQSNAYLANRDWFRKYS